MTLNKIKQYVLRNCKGILSNIFNLLIFSFCVYACIKGFFRLISPDFWEAYEKIGFSKVEAYEAFRIVYLNFIVVTSILFYMLYRIKGVYRMLAIKQAVYDSIFSLFAFEGIFEIYEVPIANPDLEITLEIIIFCLIVAFIFIFTQRIILPRVIKKESEHESDFKR